MVDYTVTNLWSSGASVQTWWLADASVWDTAATYSLGAAPDRVAGSFRLPYSFYATVTVFATTYWPDGRITTNASWAIPVADCTVPVPPTTMPAEPTTTTTPAEPSTTVDDGKDKDGKDKDDGRGRLGITTGGNWSPQRGGRSWAARLLWLPRHSRISSRPPPSLYGLDRGGLRVGRGGAGPSLGR